MKGKEGGDFYKRIFFWCQPEDSLAADRCHNATPVNPDEQYHTENRRLQNAKLLLSLCSFLSLTVTAAESRSWKVKTLVVGERDILFTPQSPVPTPSTTSFFSEPMPDSFHPYDSRDSHCPHTAQGRAGIPVLRAESPLPTGHWGPGQNLQLPWALQTAGCALTLGFLRMYALAFSCHLIPTWGVSALEQS